LKLIFDMLQLTSRASKM